MGARPGQRPHCCTGCSPSYFDWWPAGVVDDMLTTLLPRRQRGLDLRGEHTVEVPPPGPRERRTRSGTPPPRSSPSAGTRTGWSRTSRVQLGSRAVWCTTTSVGVRMSHLAAGAAGRNPRGGVAATRGPQRSGARGGHGVTLAGLDRSEPDHLPGHRTPRVRTSPPRRAPQDATWRTVRSALVATFHADIAEDSDRLRYALVCWTGLNRAATRRQLRADLPQSPPEVLASTLEHALRTSGPHTARPTRSSRRWHDSDPQPMAASSRGFVAAD